MRSCHSWGRFLPQLRPKFSRSFFFLFVCLSVSDIFSCGFTSTLNYTIELLSLILISKVKPSIYLVKRSHFDRQPLTIGSGQIVDSRTCPASLTPYFSVFSSFSAIHRKKMGERKENQEKNDTDFSPRKREREKNKLRYRKKRSPEFFAFAWIVTFDSDPDETNGFRVVFLRATQPDQNNDDIFKTQNSSKKTLDQGNRTYLNSRPRFLPPNLWANVMMTPRGEWEHWNTQRPEIGEHAGKKVKSTIEKNPWVIEMCTAHASISGET